jgi:hypothetical protein
MKSKKTYVLTVSRQFMKSHPKSGQETGFVDKILAGKKIHTIRANYEFWKKRIDEVTAGSAILSVRYWSGKPYNSKQITIVDLTKEDCVGIQKLTFAPVYGIQAKIFTTGERKLIGYKPCFEIDELSKNDGLLVKDFKDWFKGYDLSQPMAIIHFTKFRY